MDGVLNLNKPLGITSARAVERVRHIFGGPKAGHAGSLDPLADGVLIVCFGAATKLVEAVMDQPKVYRATAALHVTSASFDCEQPLEPVACAAPTREQVLAALAGFEGEISQTPPATSAVKIRGRPAYKLHRAGKAPALAARPTRIYWIHVHRYEWPELDFEVACGRGTYIRALARDIGTALGTGGCLMKLRRTAVGLFRSADSREMTDLSAATPLVGVLTLEAARERLAAGRGVAPSRPT